MSSKDEGCCSSRQWGIFFYIMGGIVLMIVSGLVVYYKFCSPLNTHYDKPDMTPYLAAICPPLPPPANCPKRPLCLEPPLCAPQPGRPCPPTPTPPCEPCPTFPPCTKENCGKTCPTIAPITVPKPVVLTEKEMLSERTIDLIKRYPVNSFERLQVVTQLLEFTYVKYFDVFQRRNCEHNVKKYCNYCTDRYNYLRCAMQNNVVENYYADSDSPSRNKLVKEPDDFPSTFRNRAWKTAIYLTFDKSYSVRGEDYHNQYACRKALSFWYDKPNRKFCTPCEDDNYNHMRCMADDYKD